MDRHEDPAPTRSQRRLLDQVRGVIRRLHYSTKDFGWLKGVERAKKPARLVVFAHDEGRAVLARLHGSDG
jgi:hypothetical protein